MGVGEFVSGGVVSYKLERLVGVMSSNWWF